MAQCQLIASIKAELTSYIWSLPAGQLFGPGTDRPLSGAPGADGWDERRSGVGSGRSGLEEKIGDS